MNSKPKAIRRMAILFLLPIWMPVNHAVSPLGAQESENPLVFNFGQKYGDTKKNLQKGTIIFEKDGDVIHVKRGSLDYEYYFFLKQRIREVKLKRAVIDNRERAVLDNLIMEDVQPRGEAVLYAVCIVFPMTAFEGEAGKTILDRLVKKYGEAKGLDGPAFTIENSTTRVIGYTAGFEKKRYLFKLAFLSRVHADVRTKYFNDLKADEVKRIGEEIKKANKLLDKETKK